MRPLTGTSVAHTPAATTRAASPRLGPDSVQHPVPATKTEENAAGKTVLSLSTGREATPSFRGTAAGPACAAAQCVPVDPTAGRPSEERPRS
jgi:hypothetical protein